MLLRFAMIFICLFAMLGHSAPIQSLTISSSREFLISSLVEFDQGTDWQVLSNEGLIHAFVRFLNLQKEKSIFITDLDETLLTSKYFFGSTEWFKVIMSEVRTQIKLKNPDANADQIEKKLDQEFWKYVSLHPEMKSADQTFTQLLKSLYENGHEVFALTARNQSMSEITKMQLKSIGVEFLAEQVIYSPHNSDWTSTKGRTLRTYTESLFKKRSESGAFYRMYFFDDMLKEINSVTEAFSASPWPTYLEQVKIVHSLVSNENKKQDPLLPLFKSIGKFQETVFNSAGLKVSNDDAHHFSKVMEPQKYICYKFYYP